MFAIALDNTYMKVIINNKEATYFISWMTNSNWRYIGVTVMKTYVDDSTTTEVSSSTVKIYIDKSLATSTTVASYF